MLLAIIEINGLCAIATGIAGYVQDERYAASAGMRGSGPSYRKHTFFVGPLPHLPSPVGGSSFAARDYVLAGCILIMTS